MVVLNAGGEHLLQQFEERLHLRFHLGSALDRKKMTQSKDFCKPLEVLNENVPVLKGPIFKGHIWVFPKMVVPNNYGFSY